IARLDVGTDADDAAFIQVFQQGFGKVGNVAGDFLRPQFGVAGFDFELLDVDRSVGIFLHQFFADQDGVFKVVAAPGHESHQDVAAQSQFAAVSARTVGQDLAGMNPLPPVNYRLLVDACVLIGAAEFDELIDVRSDFARELPAVAVALDAHDDAFAVHAIHHAIAAADDDGAGIAGRDFFHTRAHQRRLRA